MTKTITLPGAIDLHVHLREPSNNKAETIASGTKAALTGGYALICDMPNNPGMPTWTAERLKDKQERINKSAYIPVGAYAGAQPESDNLDELTEMAKTAIGLKLYGSPNVSNYQDYKVEEFKNIATTWHRQAPNKPILFHRGESNLEEVILLIAGEIRHPLHICHVNSTDEVKIVVAAKKKGLAVTCGICPHHLFKTSHDSVSEGWFARMLPPLARQDETEKLFKLFVNGDIDILESDHAPHSPEAKWKAEKENPAVVHGPKETTCFGVPGIEFAIPLLLYQFNRGRISAQRLIDATSTKPAEIIGVKLLPKTEATWDLEEYRIGDSPLELSGSGWTPYLGKIAGGRVKSVILGGKSLVKDGEIVAKLSRVINHGDAI